MLVPDSATPLYLQLEEILRQEIGAVFATVLEHAGVYKCTPEGRTAFCKFIRSVS